MEEFSGDGCSFCWELKHRKSSLPGKEFRILFETDYFVVKFSLFPVTPKHLLIIPKRHFLKRTDMTMDEFLDFFVASIRIEDWYLDQGGAHWNEGANYGESAGQSIEHFHYHYFDREKGDVPNPRGGIRNFKPPLEELEKY